MKDNLRLLLARSVAGMLRVQSRPYPFPAGTALVVAPHADDETLGCGGLIGAKVQRGERVEVVFVSDSAGPATNAGRSAQGELAPRRRGEALAALGELGLAEKFVHFLAAPDGKLDHLDADQTERVQAGLSGLLAALNPAEVFVPFLGGGSTEHDATFWLAREAVASSSKQPIIWEYPVWAWWNAFRLRRQLAHAGENFALELGTLRPRKVSALAQHRSQLLAGGASGLPPVLAAACTGPTEFFFHRQAWKNRP